jgi:hypothetical protein
MKYFAYLKVSSLGTSAILQGRRRIFQPDNLAVACLRYSNLYIGKGNSQFSNLSNIED